MTETIDEILTFWFGQLDDTGMSDAAHCALWFTANEDMDTQIRDRFGHLVASAIAGGLTEWTELDSGLIALIVLLDQMSRNIYRGTPRAFSGDARALTLAQEAISSGRYQRLPAIHQVFLYMPLEHCEDLEVQQECVALFQSLADITGNARIADFSRYAQAHRDVIAQFGRFVHRNAILGRASTPAEKKYLATHKGF